MQTGSSRYSVTRVISAQKLPILPPLSFGASRRAKPRNSANASAMPVAADRKLWIVSPSIWLRFDSAASPEYHCQLVLVVKLTAVVNAPSADRPGSPRALSGRNACSLSTA